jgi:hypothetical protein
VFGWFKRWWAPKEPEVRHELSGEVLCRSSVLLLADPFAISDPVRVEGIPTGRHAVRAMLIRYPEGGERVAKIAIRFRAGSASERRPLGSIGVDAGTVVALDEATFHAHWQDVGPERIGRTGTPSHHRRVAKLIGDQFGLKWREVDFLHSVFAEPISEELEARITAFLKTFPEYADYPFMFFRIHTHNSCDRVFEAMRDRSWSQVALDGASGAHVFAVTSGFGDGRYEVEGLYEAGELRAVEIEFIGPAQEKLLEAFPLLRY